MGLRSGGGAALAGVAFGAGAVAGAAAVLAAGLRGPGALLGLVAVAAAAMAAALAAVWLGQRRDTRSGVAAIARRALVLEAIGDGVLVVDRAGVVIEWTPAAERRYGFTAAEAVGKRARELLYVRAAVEGTPDPLATLEAGADRCMVDQVHRRKDGADFEAEVVASALRDGGRISAVVLLVRDVSAQRQTERALRESEQRLGLALAAADADAWDWDRRTGRFFLGEGWAARMGITGALFGRLEDVAVLVHPEDRPRVLELLRRHAAAGRDAIMESEHRMLLADGTVRWVRMLGRATARDPDGAPARYTGTLRDVTESRALRARVEQGDRLASLGTLAAGVAREVERPVAWVAARLASARDALEVPPGEALPRERLPGLRDAVREAAAGTVRVRDIVAALRQFAAPADRAPAPVDVRAELETALGMARHELSQRARLRVDLPDSLPPVVAAPSELGQVFVNLLLHAAREVPEGRAEESELHVAAWAEEGGVAVEISGPGPGVPPDALPHPFDAMAPPRPGAAGDGLGLSIAHAIVSRVGGTIEVEGAPGRGSTFRVRMPAAPGQAAAPPG